MTCIAQPVCMQIINILPLTIFNAFAFFVHSSPCRLTSLQPVTLYNVTLTPHTLDPTPGPTYHLRVSTIPIGKTDCVMCTYMCAHTASNRFAYTLSVCRLHLVSVLPGDVTYVYCYLIKDVVKHTSVHETAFLSYHWIYFTHKSLTKHTMYVYMHQSLVHVIPSSTLCVPWYN